MTAFVTMSLALMTGSAAPAWANDGGSQTCKVPTEGPFAESAPRDRFEIVYLSGSGVTSEIGNAALLAKLVIV